MRVSRQMKDYIEKQINEKCKNEEMENLKNIRDKIQEEYRNFIENFEKEMEEKFIEESKLYGYTDKSKWYKTCKVLNYLMNPKVEAINDTIKDINSKMKKYKQDKFDEIIVALELGGKKEDLDRMLNEINFDMEE